MRQILLLAGILCLLAGTPGCDSEQPLTVEEQEFTLEFKALNAEVNKFWVWEQYWDADKNGVPDETDQYGQPIDPVIQVWCERAIDADGGPTIIADSVPWNYTLQISVIPAGESRAIALTSEDALDTGTYLNLTPYDTAVSSGQPPPTSCANDPDDVIVCNPLGTLTAGHRIVMESTFDLDDLEDPEGIFYCPGEPGRGDPTLGGTFDQPERPPFRYMLKKGDTIIVEARQDVTAPNSLEALSVPSLAAFPSLGGRTITPIGKTQSSGTVGDGFTFSYTVQ